MFLIFTLKVEDEIYMIKIKMIKASEHLCKAPRDYCIVLYCYINKNELNLINIEFPLLTNTR